MAYTVYLGEVMLPVPPAKLQLKIKNQNKTITLIDEGEVNILKRAGLTEISFKVLLPNVLYPFAQYTSGFKSAAYYLEHLEKLKTQTDQDGNLIPFQFIISRAMPDGKILFGTNMKVALEDYKAEESADDGFDIIADITLKQYRPYGTKTVEFKQPVSVGSSGNEGITSPDSSDAGGAIAPGGEHVTQAQTTAYIEHTRTAENAPQAQAYTVVSGDSLWAIAKKYLNDGNLYPEIYALNQAIIDKGNKGTGSTKYTIYPGQVLALPM